MKESFKGKDIGNYISTCESAKETDCKDDLFAIDKIIHSATENYCKVLKITCSIERDESELKFCYLLS